MWTPPERIKFPIGATQWPSAREASASRLYSPLDFQNLHLEQRTWVPAMVPWRATEGGEVTPAVLDWYGRFAAGQPGAIVVEATGIRDIPSGPLLRIGAPRFREGLSQLVERVGRESKGKTRLFIQLIDFLPIKRRPLREKFIQRFLEITPEHYTRMEEIGFPCAREPLHGPIRTQIMQLDDSQEEQVLSRRELESLRFGYRERVDDLHLDSIRELPHVLPELFSAAAREAENVGFHGVELHYAHAYTMASFLSATNQRTDGYGGSREERVRLPSEVFQAVRNATSSSFAVGCRILGDEIISGGSRNSDAAAYAVEFAKRGMDFISISTGGKFEDASQPKVGHAAYPYTGQSGYECMPSVRSDARGPFARNAHLAGAIRAQLRNLDLMTPIVTAGGINSFELAEELLNNETADIIGAARQSLADPDWFLKMKDGDGESIRRCQFTNYCEALDQQHKEVTCRLWDRVFEEGENAPRTRDGKRRLTAPNRSALKID